MSHNKTTSRLTEDLERSNERFRCAMNAVSDVLWTASPEGGFVVEQPGWSRLTGHEWEQYRGWGWGKAIHPEDLADVHAKWRHSQDSREQYDATYRMIHRDGTYRWMHARAVPLVMNDAVVEWIGVQTDVHDHHVAEAELNRSRRKAADLVEQNPIPMWVNDGGGTMVLANAALRSYAGVTGDHVDLGSLVHPDDVNLRNQSREAIAYARRYDVALRLRSARGDYRTFRVCVAPLYEGDVVCAWIGTAVDVHDAFSYQNELRTELATNHVLLSELNHRVRNTLSVVQSMVRHTLRRARSLSDFGRVLEGRVRGLSATHDVLVAETWHGAHVGAVVNAALAVVLPPSTWTVPVTHGDVYINATQAVALGTLLHELATNALLYGACGSGGTAVLDWYVERERLLFTWRETGGRTVTAPHDLGLGIRLASDIGSQLLGTSTPHFDPDGFHFILDVPLHGTQIPGAA